MIHILNLFRYNSKNNTYLRLEIMFLKYIASNILEDHYLSLSKYFRTRKPSRICKLIFYNFSPQNDLQIISMGIIITRIQLIITTYHLLYLDSIIFDLYKIIIYHVQVFRRKRGLIDFQTFYH